MEVRPVKMTSFRCFWTYKLWKCDVQERCLLLMGTKRNCSKGIGYMKIQFPTSEWKVRGSHTRLCPFKSICSFISVEERSKMLEDDVLRLRLTGSRSIWSSLLGESSINVKLTFHIVIFKEADLKNLFPESWIFYIYFMSIIRGRYCETDWWTEFFRKSCYLAELSPPSFQRIRSQTPPSNFEHDFQDIKI